MGRGSSTAASAAITNTTNTVETHSPFIQVNAKMER